MLIALLILYNKSQIFLSLFLIIYLLHAIDLYYMEYVLELALI